MEDARVPPLKRIGTIWCWFSVLNVYFISPFITLSINLSIYVPGVFGQVHLVTGYPNSGTIHHITGKSLSLIPSVSPAIRYTEMPTNSNWVTNPVIRHGLLSSGVFCLMLTHYSYTGIGSSELFV
jgi:hypothetical protein